MKKLFILHLGVGNVGKALVNQIGEFGGKELVYSGMFTSKGGIFKKTGLTGEDIQTFRPAGKTVEEAISQTPLPFVLVDTTASDKTLPYIRQALKRGGFVVMSNKKPVAGSQKDFDLLHKLGGNRLYYETTVGAGLPVISTIKTFLGTGDDVTEIQGCFSGTLGFLFSEMEKGITFSAAVKKAKALGFTEPDPRDDLSGVDVARKALILARLTGRKLSPDDISLEGLYPKTMEKLSVEAFLDQIIALDNSYKEKIAKARKEGKVLRFMATISKKSCSVGLRAVDAASDIGNLKGPDNIVIIKTKRYSQNPLVIKGPGAGVEVTAAGVFGDILAVARIFN